MKDLFKDPDLWRQKRDQLPVDAEAQSGWQEMQSILDKHLPLLPLTSAPHVSKIAKAIKAIKAMKATSILIASLTVATVTGTVIYIIKTRQHQNTSHHQPQKHRQAIGKDSLNTAMTVDSVDPDTKVDSLYALQKLTSSINKTDSINNITIAGQVNSNNNQGKLALKNNKSATNQQVINGGNAQANSTLSPNHNSTGYLTSGNYRSNHLQVSTGNLTKQQGTVSGSNTLAEESSSDSATQNSNSTDNNIMLLSATQISMAQLFGMNNNSFIKPQIFSNQSLSKFIITGSDYAARGNVRQIKNSNNKNKANKNPSTKNGKAKGGKISSSRPLSTVFANMDWGFLLGANTSGSFTPGSQNRNIYGSFPIDIYPGLFGTYHLNDKWAINAQVRFLTPLNLGGSYDNKSFSQVDSAQFVKVTDSRKAYFVNVPIHVMYKINNNISIKGGPVINLPVKQINSNTNLQRLDMNLDTIYFANAQNKIKTTRYDQKINFGLSGGVSVQFNRLIFEAVYQKNLSGYQVISDFGNYKTNPGTLQISVGFKLNGSKHH
ncbi:outer membrane beta-barrel protein [Mucilaginibacter rubeus]|uniref:PorT family protein n=1 Tax=Mucilaginibacter rubeus TaxID=2027860 RepID=A0A5C1HW66_9SPHI|nr:outer membrane beta-barrel protein [Mucilaginibacter rubeus]QEM09905.1 PorT family protein [Mucilaginibacter rubeus]